MTKGVLKPKLNELSTKGQKFSLRKEVSNFGQLPFSLKTSNYFVRNFIDRGSEKDFSPFSRFLRFNLSRGFSLAK